MYLVHFPRMWRTWNGQAECECFPLRFSWGTEVLVLSYDGPECNILYSYAVSCLLLSDIPVSSLLIGLKVANGRRGTGGVLPPRSGLGRYLYDCNIRSESAYVRSFSPR